MSAWWWCLWSGVSVDVCVGVCIFVVFVHMSVRMSLPLSLALSSVSSVSSLFSLAFYYSLLMREFVVVDAPCKKRNVYFHLFPSQNPQRFEFVVTEV